MATQIRLFDLTGLSTFAVPADPAEDTLSTWRFMGSPNASCTVTAQSVAGTLRVVENECDKTILLGGNPVAVRTSNQFVLSGSTIRVMNPVGEAVAAAADLTTSVFDARMADGTGVWVVAAGATHGEWRLDKTSVLAVNGATVVATLSGVGRWIYFGAGASGGAAEFDWFETLADAAAAPGPAVKTGAIIAETNGEYEFVPGDVTAINGWTSIGNTGGTNGRWLLKSDKISIASIDNGVSDDWVRLNLAMAACAGKCAIHLRAGTWRCNTAGAPPSNLEIVGEPGVRVVSTQAPSGAQIHSIFFATPVASANVGTVSVTPAIGSVTADIALPNPPVAPLGLRLTSAGGQTAAIYDVTAVANLGAGVYRLTLDRPIVFQFVATNSAEVLTSYPHDIIIRGNGMVMTGTGDRAIELAGAARCTVEDVVYDPSGGLMSECAFAYDNGGRENVFENLYANTKGAGANVAGFLLESQERSVARHCRSAWATGGAFEIINSFGTVIETSHAYDDTLGSFGLDDGAGLGLGCFNCTIRDCTAVNSASTAYSVGKSKGAILENCEATTCSLSLGVLATATETVISRFYVRDSSSGTVAVLASGSYTEIFGFTATNVVAPAGNVNKLINVTGTGDVDFRGLHVITLVTSVGDMQVLNMEGGNAQRTTVSGARITMGNATGYGFWNQLGILTLENANVTGGGGISGARVSAAATLRLNQNVRFIGATGGVIYIAGSYISKAQVQLTANNPVAVPFPDLTAEDKVEVTRRVVAGGTGLSPLVVLTPGTGFTIVGPVGDTDTYDWAVV